MTCSRFVAWAFGLAACLPTSPFWANSETARAQGLASGSPSVLVHMSWGVGT